MEDRSVCSQKCRKSGKIRNRTANTTAARGKLIRQLPDLFALIYALCREKKERRFAQTKIGKLPPPPPQSYRCVIFTMPQIYFNNQSVSSLLLPTVRFSVAEPKLFIFGSGSTFVLYFGSGSSSSHIQLPLKTVL